MKLPLFIQNVMNNIIFHIMKKNRFIDFDEKPFYLIKNQKPKLHQNTVIMIIKFYPLPQKQFISQNSFKLSKADSIGN